MEDAAEIIGDGDFRRVSIHDPWRCWVTHLFVEKHVSPRIVVALGGWSSYDAIGPYLTAPTEKNHRFHKLYNAVDFGLPLAAIPGERGIHTPFPHSDFVYIGGRKT